MATRTNRVAVHLTRARHIAPLAGLRIAFGAVLFISTIRFMANGWIKDFYLTPTFHFPFAGLEWLHPMGATGMYTLYAVMAAAALCICLGLFYRVMTVVFFICFCYTELLDKTYYLNHYYLVTIFSFLLIVAPAHRYCSVDAWRKPQLRRENVPAWAILMFQYQLVIVYFCAGLSKCTHDWLIEAMPLRIWLPVKASIPLIGPLLRYEWTAYLFSWAGALFDLSIAWILMSRRTRQWGYWLVVIFHVLTAVLFQIGMFPYLMMSATLIFFSTHWHLRIINGVRSLAGVKSAPVIREGELRHRSRVLLLLGVFFLVQLTLPFRYLLYPGHLLWTEEGYRFSWRVMLMEKGGTTFFFVKDPSTRRKFEVNNRTFLTPYQERMMETQPDMMVQYAHMLKQVYEQEGIVHPEVTVQSYVTLNGSGSRLYIDSTVNLADVKETLWGHQSWILPFNKK